METAKSLIANIFGGNGHARTCETCGNEYENCFEVRMNGETHVFDSFECAIHKLAAGCAHCGCKIIGHGVQANGVLYCCAHCARQNSVQNLDEQMIAERSMA